MPHIASDHARHLGDSVDDGHCVAYVRKVAGLPHSSRWRRGVKVRGGDVTEGTIISTFGRDGRYPSSMSGDSHCAVLLAEHSNGLLVRDQWLGQDVHDRIIRFRGGAGKPINDGDAYYVVELADEE